MGQNFARNWLVPLSGFQSGTFMHSPALNNDKDPYELSVTSEPGYPLWGGDPYGMVWYGFTTWTLLLYEMVWEAPDSCQPCQQAWTACKSKKKSEKWWLGLVISSPSYKPQKLVVCSKKCPIMFNHKIFCIMYNYSANYCPRLRISNSFPPTLNTNHSLSQPLPPQ